MNGTTIAIACQKGGVGKTTSSITIAAYLARKNKRILLVDIDAQCNASSVLLDNCESLREEQTVAVLLRDEPPDLNQIVHPTKVPGLFLIPAHSRLSEADVVLSQLMARETRLKILLGRLKASYEFILIDCPPNVNWIPINAFVAADYVLVPVSPNFFDLGGIKLTIKTMESVRRYHNPHIILLGVFMTVYDHRNSISHEIYSLLKV